MKKKLHLSKSCIGHGAGWHATMAGVVAAPHTGQLKEERGGSEGVHALTYQMVAHSQ